MKRQFVLQLVANGADTKCAADLLRYFRRHPRVYVTTEQLAFSVGYDRGDIETGISTLTRAGLLIQRRHPRSAAVLYRLVADNWLSELAKAASNVRGRRQLFAVLRSGELCRRAAAVRMLAEAQLHRSATLLDTMTVRRGGRSRNETDAIPEPRGSEPAHAP